jgi:hypothetical protein
LFRGALSATVADRVIGGTHDTFEILSTAMGALHLNGILATNGQKLEKFVAL